jgi:hypothetical protein
MDNFEILVYIATSLPIIGVIMAVKLKHLHDKRKQKDGRSLQA